MEFQLGHRQGKKLPKRVKILQMTENFVFNFLKLFIFII